MFTLHLKKTKSEINLFESCPVWPDEHSSTAKHMFNLHGALVAGTPSDFNISLWHVWPDRATDCTTVPAEILYMLYIESLVPGHKNRHWYCRDNK